MASTRKKEVEKEEKDERQTLLAGAIWKCRGDECFEGDKDASEKTVADKEIRKKLACLAIVSSVLLSTNLKMKMLKEHADVLEDLDEFFAFPWGHLAFDMLMSSIMFFLRVRQ